MNNFKKRIYKKETEEYKVSPYIIAKATQVFENKQWAIDKNSDDMSINWQKRFNMYCSMLNQLEEIQQELILELTNEYVYISSIDYTAQLNCLLTKLYKGNYENVRKYNKVYVMPLIAPTDKALNKVKSSTYLAYMFSITELAYNEYLKDNNNKDVSFKRVEEIESLPHGINNKDGSIIFLVDDFIGTGDTAIEALDELLKAGISKEKIIVISLLGMNFGIEKLKSQGIQVFSSSIKYKGITDRYEGQELEQKKEIMKSIENNMNIKPELEFGYKGSEALVTMARTPNNTFPIFWQDDKKRGYLAPFPRR